MFTNTLISFQRDDANAIHREAIHCCEEAFDVLGAPKSFRISGNARDFIDSGIESLQEYANSWKHLRPELDKVKRGGILAR
jgi:hypothetical protein